MQRGMLVAGLPGEHLFDRFIASSSQEMESPTNPGRFKRNAHWVRQNPLRLYSTWKHASFVYAYRDGIDTISYA